MIAVLVNFVVSGDGSKPESSLPLEVDPSMTLDDVSAILEVETGVPNELMKFVLSARVLGERGKTLSDYNVREGDVVHVTRVPHSPPLAPSAVPAPYRAPHHGGGRRRSNMGHRGHRLDPEVYSSLSLEDLPGDLSATELHAILQVNPGICEELLKRGQTELVAAAREPTPGALSRLLTSRSVASALPEATRLLREAEMRRRLAADPMDAEAQRFLHEAITRENVTTNRDLAMEHMPEAFTRVDMLYVESKVNGTPLKIFVDCGAQSTIMSKTCAERVGLMRLVDTNFAGTAVGVGTAVILGRVHMAPIEIGGCHFPCSFSIIDQDSTEFLLGLDFLKRYQCCIDLHKNVLRLQAGGGAPTEVPFLATNQIPAGGLGSGGSGGSSSAMADGDDGAASSAAPPSSSSSSSSSSGGAASSSASGAGGPPAAAASRAPLPGAPSSPALRSAAAPPGTTTAAVRGSPHLMAGAPLVASSGLFAPIDLSALGGGGGAPRAAAAAGSASAARGGGPVGVAPPPLPGVASSAVPRGGAATAPAVGGALAAADAGALASLLLLGYPRTRCEQALTVAGGDVEAAAALLSDGAI